MPDLPISGSQIPSPVAPEVSKEQLEQALTDITRVTEDRSRLLRDAKGKFKAKRPLEFTWPHFVLEVGEVTIAILLAQVISELWVWLLK